MAGPSYHGRTHLPGGTDPIPGLTLGDEAPVPFYEAVADLAPTRDLRGYWRLGEGGLGPYLDTSGVSFAGEGPSPMTRVDATVDMTDIADGALAGDEDDGAVQFNSSTGVTSDYLNAINHWGSITENPFEGDMGTIAGWVKPFASASTFAGSLFSTIGNVGSLVGYCLGVEWPSRRIFHQRATTRLLGPTLAADEWVFACAVKDGTSSRLYLDGALVATGAAVDGTPGTNPEPLIGRFNLSADADGTMYGAVDEVSVWASALTDSEIATLAASGGLAGSDEGSVIATSGAYTAAIGDDVILATGTFTVTLPTAVGNTGASITIKNAGVGTITVARTSSQTIDGAASDISLTVSKSAREFVSDGTGWQIVSAYL